MDTANRRLLLRARPDGIAGPEHFLEDAVPLRHPTDNEVLVETLYISIDPAMRVWVSENPGYVPRAEIGDVMRAGGIGRVIESKSDSLKPGDLVQGRMGWQTHPTLRAAETQKLDPQIGSPEEWIGPLGTTALTAYFGVRDVGALRPNETLLVSGAAGGVGQIAAQIGKLDACRVVGIAGGAEKCGFLRESLNLDAVIDYKSEPDLAAAIGRACPDGIDVFFDNVGGPTLDAALLHLRIGARVVVCGRISQTASSSLYGVRNLGLLIGKRARMQGFVVFDYHDRYREARSWLAAQVRAGRLQQRLHVINGLERAPDGLGMLFRGENHGKLVVKVAE
ncbi:MAG TPA: NADP-dependent oxidoreductase [Acetobacteraceae bacterium]|nr:NADP-dependent oxidoreductase [Acetobacteraceae bacterium]